jgi:hypothetical protein
LCLRDDLLESIIQKQTKLEENFDIKEYFGGLNIQQLSEDVNDSRLDGNASLA